ncbi:MAG: ANTAR domain-containing response regulator [Akkermansiaceae bacterium]
MPTTLNINEKKVIVAHEDKLLCDELTSMLKKIGYGIISQVNTLDDLKLAALKNTPDLIVTGINFNGINVVDTLIEIADENPLPAVIVAKNLEIEDIEKAMEDHVMGYLVDPVDQTDLESTCYLVLRRFEQFQELRLENIELKEALVARKKIERAKGIIMEKYQLTEEEAYLRIRKAATKRRIKLTEVADIIIDATVTE